MSATAEQPEATRASGWSDERDALIKALAGAFLFGIPLLFTMEMWWLGETVETYRLVGFAIGGLLVNVALARVTGFRREDPSLLHAVQQGVESFAIGVVAALAVLAVLGQVDVSTPLPALVGMLVLQAVPLSLGAAVANLVFAGSAGRGLGEASDDEGSSDDADTEPRHGAAFAEDVLGTVAGAIFIGFAIAPTDEIPMLAAGMGSMHLLVLLGATLLLSYVIVFASGFDPSHRGGATAGYFQHPFSETMLAYVLALVVAALMLFGFGQVQLGDPLGATLAKVMVLAVPASVGGAAGRVVV